MLFITRRDTGSDGLQGSRPATCVQSSQPPKRPRTRLAKRLEYCLWVVAFLTLGYCGFLWLQARVYQAEGNRELDRHVNQDPASPTLPAPETRAPPVYGSLIGRLEIPRLGLSAIVFEGTDAPVLERGVGHLKGSPLPGETGNVVLAGHRDTFFRSLRKIRESDLITVTTENGRRRYVVDSTMVVSPRTISVLDDTATATMTLVTCYPFHYVGHAPERFVVRCRAIAEQSAGPEPVATPIAMEAAPNQRRAKIAARPRKPVALAKGEPAAPVELVESPSQPLQSEINDKPAADQLKRHRKWISPKRLLGKLAHVVRPKPSTPVDEPH